MVFIVRPSGLLDAYRVEPQAHGGELVATRAQQVRDGAQGGAARKLAEVQRHDVGRWRERAHARLRLVAAGRPSCLVPLGRPPLGFGAAGGLVPLSWSMSCCSSAPLVS